MNELITPPTGIRRRAAVFVALAVLAFPPAAFSDGPSSVLTTLQKQIADQTTTLSALMDQTTGTMRRLDRDLGALTATNREMGNLVRVTADLERRTHALSTKLGTTRARVGAQSATLGRVQSQVTALDGQMGALGARLSGALASTDRMRGGFGGIAGRMSSMSHDTSGLLRAMGASVGEVTYFAGNRLQRRDPGGSSTRYGALNTLGGTRVMSVMLPMITALQRGGLLISDKVGHTTASSAVDQILRQQAPDGTNVKATIIPFDGHTGLPSQAWFLGHRVGGF
jgi:hypothetical protein